MRAAASRTFWTAGSKRPMRIAMMAMTTSNSIRVNARRAPGRRSMGVGLAGVRGGLQAVGNDLAVVDQADAHPVGRVDRVLDRPDRPVGHGGGEHAGVR